ncbi:beta-galactosidase [Micromonospora sp. NBC_01813]|uniref:beta-galactosidase n=1 Tax=Micromonospora sp. NBC_01813 TaxID=2975988 RepID=UPI002DDB200C|nr:beta-galactosidase [Micromonospora sp. NBC_01813]WSA08702.1 beta-galactosidase [Micromonospora sp. NBC_01813]
MTGLGMHTLTAGRGLIFGGDYNPEQWPEEVWAQDAALMRAAGVNLATVGVFSWARIEPEPGVRDFGWLDRVLELLHDAGVAVDLATPTASPPPWLGHRWPQTLPVDESGHTLWYGSRNQFCPCSPIYRERALALVTDLADRYADHPALALWHVGNEYGQVCHCDVAAQAFRDWLQDRYGDLAGLNEAWGTTFWSQRYGDWAEILPPRRAPYLVNPTQRLDFWRFTSDALRAHFRAERDVLRARTPQIPVTTNFMGLFKPVDYWSWAGDEDIVANDWYPDPADPDFPARAALTHDLIRSLGGGRPWLLLESATGAVNWRPHNLPKPAGQLRLESLQAVARGADGVCYFQWRASRFGAERFHSAMLPHAGPDTRAHAEVRAHGAELRRLAPVVGERVAAQVALLHDWPSWWALEEPGRPSDRINAVDQLFGYYHPLWRRGVTVDLAHPESDLTGYACVVAPNLYLISDAAAQALTRYVAGGGTLLVGPFSGVADPNGHIRTGRFPAPLREVLGGSGEAWLPAPADQPVRCRWADGTPFTASVWTESLRVEGAEPVATFVDGDLAAAPAVLRHRFGAGTAWYVATIADPAPQAELIERVLADAGVVGVLSAAADTTTAADTTAVGGGPRELPPGVEAIRRGPLLFLLNHGADPAHVPIPDPAEDLLTNELVTGRLTLAPRAVLALRPRS